MLKNKIFILFIAVICFFTLFNVSVYATDIEENMIPFTDFDGDFHNILKFPEELNNYNHYIIYMFPSVSSYEILPFNESIEVANISTSSISKNILVDGGAYYCYFSWDSSLSEWQKYDGNGISKFEIKNTDFKLIGACSCLQPQSSDLIKSFEVGAEGFFLSRPEVLAPIVDKAPMEMVLQEIVEILPIVIVVLVGLIGLRKALAFLQNLLHRS